jgi:hypothetical protein
VVHGLGPDGLGKSGRTVNPNRRKPDGHGHNPIGVSCLSGCPNIYLKLNSSDIEWSMEGRNDASDHTVDGHYEFVMRTELVAALVKMNWIK